MRDDLPLTASHSLLPTVILYLSVVSVNHIISPVLILHSACLLPDSGPACALLRLLALSLLIHLCEQLLCTVHQFLFAGLQFINLSVCQLVTRVAVNELLSKPADQLLNCCLIISINLVAHFFHGLLGLEYHGICIISCINAFFTSSYPEPRTQLLPSQPYRSRHQTYWSLR